MPVELSIRLPAESTAPAAARHALACFEVFVDEEWLDRLRLVVSELVTNSYRHAGLSRHDQVTVHARLDGGKLCAEVVDAGPGFRRPERFEPKDTPGGLGLYLVDRSVDRWGVTRDPWTRVWVEIDVGEGGPPS